MVLNPSYPGPGTAALNAAIVAPTGPTIGYTNNGQPFIVPGSLDFSWKAREAYEAHKKELYKLYGVRIKGTWELHPDAEALYAKEEGPKFFQELKRQEKEKEFWSQLSINRANGNAWEKVVSRFIDKDPQNYTKFHTSYT